MNKIQGIVNFLYERNISVDNIESNPYVTKVLEENGVTKEEAKQIYDAYKDLVVNKTTKAKTK